MKLFVLVIVFSLLLNGLMLAVRGDMTDEPEINREEETLVIAQIFEPTDFNPISYTDVYTGYIFRQIFDPLIQTYPEGVPNVDGRAVAESFDVSDDGILYTFEIEKGIEFHNGEELTAEDIKFSLDTIRGESDYTGDDEPSSPRERDLAAIGDILVVDDYTLEIHMEEIDSEMLYKSAFESLVIVPKDYIMENSWTAFENELFGTGPYKFMEYEPGDEVVLEAHEDFRGELNIEKMVFDFFDEESSAVFALRNGDVHYMSRIKPTNYHDLIDKGIENVVTTSYPQIGHQRIAFNHRDEVIDGEENPFIDARVRKAFAYAIDMDEVIAAVRTDELADNTRSPLPDVHPAHPPGLETYDQDIEKAKQLLEDAGYPDGLETTLYTSADERADEMFVVQEQVENAGITLNLEAVEWGTYLEQVQAGNAPLSFSGWSGTASAEFTMNYMHGYSPWSYYSGWYGNTEVDDLVQEAIITKGEERWDYYHEAQRIMVEEDMGCLIAYTERVPQVYHESLTIPEEVWNPYMGGGPFYGAHLWELEEKPEEYVLTVNVEGEGTVDVEPVLEEYEEGSWVNLKAIQEDGWEFDEWTGDVPEGEEDEEITLTMNEDKEVTAVFLQDDDDDGTPPDDDDDTPGFVLPLFALAIIFTVIIYHTKRS